MGANDEGKENLIMKKDDDNITLHQETKNIDKIEITEKKSNLPIFTEEDKVYRVLQNEFRSVHVPLNRNTNNMLCYCYMLFFLLSQFQKKVKGYKFAVFTTEACPRNKTEWEKRESLFNCSKDSSSYACLPNENITELLEFCYPLQVLASHEGKNNVFV